MFWFFRLVKVTVLFRIIVVLVSSTTYLETVLQALFIAQNSEKAITLVCIIDETWFTTTWWNEFMAKHNKTETINVSLYKRMRHISNIELLNGSSKVYEISSRCYVKPRCCGCSFFQPLWYISTIMKHDLCKHYIIFFLTIIRI